jgi:hypothetical protein
MRGLFEWKILAAIFAVLIVASSALVSNTGLKDMFLNSTGSLGDWMHGSPFSSLFATPEKITSGVVIVLDAEELELGFGDPVNITAGESSVLNFRGVLELNLQENKTKLVPEDSELVLDLRLEEMQISDVKISSLVLENIDFVVRSEKTNITATDDRIEIHDFCGDVKVTDVVELSGNVSKVKDEKWSIG